MSILKNFTLPLTAPELIGGVGQGGDTEKFVQLFGTRWKKTPKKGVWFIGTDKLQITAVEAGTHGLDFAFYDYDTVEEFKKDFDEGRHVFNAQYFQLNNTGVHYKYPAIRIIAFLKEHSLW